MLLQQPRDASDFPRGAKEAERGWNENGREEKVGNEMKEKREGRREEMKGDRREEEIIKQLKRGEENKGKEGRK